MTDEDLEFKQLALDMTSAGSVDYQVAPLLSRLAPRGLWLITGGPKSGKTALLAALTLALGHKLLYLDEYAVPFDDDNGRLLRMIHQADRLQVPAVVCVTGHAKYALLPVCHSIHCYNTARLQNLAEVVLVLHSNRWTLVKNRQGTAGVVGTLDFSGALDLGPAYELVHRRAYTSPSLADRMTWVEEQRRYQTRTL
jgi:hypothetical protein